MNPEGGGSVVVDLFHFPLFVEVLSWSLFCYDEERAGCFVFIVFWMSNCYCKCPVALPYGAVGWSAVCDCGIS